MLYFLFIIAIFIAIIKKIINNPAASGWDRPRVHKCLKDLDSADASLRVTTCPDQVGNDKMTAISQDHTSTTLRVLRVLRGKISVIPVLLTLA